MQARFDFYEQVRISTDDARTRHLNGRNGVVLGRTETTDGYSWYYTVAIDGDPEGWCFFERELEATGRQFKREDFYDGSSIVVKVDETGRGYID